MLMPGRSWNAVAPFRYGFNGKENDNEVKGIGDQIDYGERGYDPRVGRFLSVDPLTRTYPWYTPYQFAGNKPIWAVDLDGLEEHTATTSIFKLFLGSPGGYLHPRTAMDNMSNANLQTMKGIHDAIPPPARDFIGGAFNTAAGLTGSIASVGYISESGGVGAMLGGVVSLQFSLSQAGIGVAQMIDAFSTKPNDDLQNSSNIAGLIAYGINFKYAGAVDAMGGMIPSLTMSGNKQSFLNFEGYTKDAFGAISAAQDVAKSPNIVNTLNFLNQAYTEYGASIQSFQLFSEGADAAHLKQVLDYTLSYSVKAGDNLGNIAKRLGTSVDQLVKQNGIKNPDKIDVGQTIKIHNTEYGEGGNGGKN